MKLIPTLALIILSIFGFSQSPTISFQKTFGGNMDDAGKDMVQLPNGDLVICAHSNSNISGDKTENGFGGNDYWILQVTSSGNIVWQTTIGGTGDDLANAIIRTTDGGFLVNGNSNSPISGNKTSPNYGSWDSWVVKLSATGQIEWQKNFGGQGIDTGVSLLSLGSGDYLICNSSASDITGSKTEPSKGGTDFWTITITNNGSDVTQNVYGGLGNDFLKDAKLFNNRIYLTGNSGSNISGDKGQDSYGVNDYWTLILDVNGSIISSSTEGGSDYESVKSVINRTDEIVLFGTSRSDNSGSKTSVSYGQGDFWCVTLDPNLSRTDEIVFGGSDIEGKFGDVGGVYYTAIHQYVVGGSSLSEISGNKTIGAFDVGYGDLWMIGFDTLGVKKFEFVAGGDNEELFGRIIESNNNTLLIVGSSHSGISGNKTVSNNGQGDIWLLELDFNLSIETIVNSNELTTYPNPVQTVLNFSLPITVDQSQVSLTDITGKTVYSNQLEMVSEHKIDVSSMANGVYVLSVISKEFQYTRKIIID